VAVFRGVPDVESVMQQTELQVLRDHKDSDPDVLNPEPPADDEAAHPVSN